MRNGALYMLLTFLATQAAGLPQIRNSRISNYDGYYYDYVVRTKSLDVYSTQVYHNPKKTLFQIILKPLKM